jgi:hypothetical protein
MKTFLWKCSMYCQRIFEKGISCKTELGPNYQRHQWWRSVLYAWYHIEEGCWEMNLWHLWDAHWRTLQYVCPMCFNLAHGTDRELIFHVS